MHALKNVTLNDVKCCISRCMYDGKKTRVWVGIKLQEHASHVSKESLTLKKRSKRVKSEEENDKRVLRGNRNLEEMFKKLK